MNIPGLPGVAEAGRVSRLPIALAPVPQLLSRPLRPLLTANLALLLAAAPALAAPNQPSPAAPANRGKASDLVSPAPAGRSQRDRASEPHRLTAQLNALGAVSCLARAEQVARFLDQSNAGAVAVMPLASYPNQRQVAANLVIPQADGNDALAIITLAPNQANGCGLAYQLMTTEPGSCSAALKARQAEPEGAVPLGRSVRIQRLTQDSAFLGWQLKDTCLIIKQQSTFN